MGTEYICPKLAAPLQIHVSQTEEGATATNFHKLNKSTADLYCGRKKQWTDEELKEAQDRRHAYHVRIINPARRFQNKAKEIMSEARVDAKVSAFQAAEDSDMKREVTDTDNAKTC
jgi:hypothetical protein